MESPFKPPAPQPADTGNPVVIQQFARYPPVFDSPLRSGSPGSAKSRIAASQSPPLRRKDTPRSVQSSPRGPLSGGLMPPSGLRADLPMSPPPAPPAELDPRPAPAKAPDADAEGDAERRELPSRDVTDETIDDAYVSFIMYCNPNVPASTDTSELRKTFRAPPRSDGKSFSIFVLWELIRKLDQKELKTWIQLAIELGVEPPSMEKKQSTQKVQQYAVRLKVGLSFSAGNGQAHTNSCSAGCEQCTSMHSSNISLSMIISITNNSLYPTHLQSKTETACL